MNHTSHVATVENLAPCFHRRTLRPTPQAAFHCLLGSEPTPIRRVWLQVLKILGLLTFPTPARASWGLRLASWAITNMSSYWIDSRLRIRHQGRAPKRRWRQECGAKCRDGHACCAPAVWDKLTNRPRNGRCKLHGGFSTGPRTPEGKARIAAAQRERWRQWRERSAVNQTS